MDESGLLLLVALLSVPVAFVVTDRTDSSWGLVLMAPFFFWLYITNRQITQDNRRALGAWIRRRAR